MTDPHPHLPALLVKFAFGVGNIHFGIDNFSFYRIFNRLAGITRTWLSFGGVRIQARSDCSFHSAHLVRFRNGRKAVLGFGGDIFLATKSSCRLIMENVPSFFLSDF